MIHCVEKCKKKLEKEQFTNKIVLYNFFIKTWGNISINYFDNILKKIDIISKYQDKFGKIPSEINTCFNTYYAKYNQTLQSNALYIILLYTCNQIILNQNLLEKYSYQLLISIQYMRNNYTKNKANCFQNIVIYQALKYAKKMLNDHFELQDSTINIEIEKIKEWTFKHYWNGQYFKTKTKEFSEEINGFAIMFNLVNPSEIQKIIKGRKLLYFLNSNLNHQLLFLLSCIKWSNLDWIDKELCQIESKNSLSQKNTTCSLYITCRLALEKEKILRKN